MGKINQKTISIFVSHQGCPNDCVFCNQRKITGVNGELNSDRVIDEIEKCLSTIDHNDVEIAFFGGSFTAIEDKKQLELLKIAGSYIDLGKASHIRISTRPDAVDEVILDRLWDHNVRVIELGVQSMDDEVLQASSRGHDSSCVYSSSELILKKGFKLGLQMMIGLPLDTEEKIYFTANEFVKIMPHFVRIYPVLVIHETELESLFKNKKFTPWELETAVRVAKNLYSIFQKNNIEVVRIGLQSSDTIAMGKDIVAGPWHPAFGELVYSLIFRDIIEENLSKIHFGDHINIRAPRAKISQLVGNQKSNYKYFKDKYRIHIKVSESETQDSFWIQDLEIPLKKYFNAER